MQQREHATPWRDIRIFQTRIRRNIKLAESPSYGQTIFEYEKLCHGAEDYQMLAEEVDSMGAETRSEESVAGVIEPPSEGEPGPWSDAIPSESASWE